MVGSFILAKNNLPTITGISGSTVTDPVGMASHIFFSDVQKGEPRRDNLFLIRILGRTPYIETVKDIIKKQVASTEFGVRPTFDDPSEKELQICESARKFFDGNFNTDHQSWDELINVLLDDILDFDSGVVELVPDQEGFLKQMIHRDGMTFTKNVLESGLLPAPDSDIPAFYQFSLSSSARMLLTARDWKGIDINQLTQDIDVLPYGMIKKRNIPFSRDQIVWFSENPVSYSAYGRGRTQKVKQVVEILLNGDIHRNRFFLENEFHKGFIQIVNGSQHEAEKLKEIFRRTRGNEYTIPVVGGESSWVSIDPSPDKMQFLESHKWYVTVALMVYGMNESEAGIHENANLSVSDEMKFNVWRRTTGPILSMIATKLNNEILPFMREYHQLGGRMEFFFEPENRFLRKLDQEIEGKDMEMGLLTLNDLRQVHGREDFGPLGDLPKHVLDSLTQRHPGWVAETMNPSIGSTPVDTPSLFSLTPINQEEKDKKEVKELSEDLITYENLFLKKKDYIKEALRNERGSFPHLNQIITESSEKIGKTILNTKKDILDSIKNSFPEEPSDKSLLINVSELTRNIKINGLSEVLEEQNMKALREGARFHETKLRKQLEEKITLPSEVKIEINFDIENTFATRQLMQNALKNSTIIEVHFIESIKRILLSAAKEGMSISQITRLITQELNEMSKVHAELIARTETLSASRQGSQALAESTPLIAGKEWIATNDMRTRPWHAAMNRVVIPKDRFFTVPRGWQGKPNYQPNDYPKSVRVAGEDQPFNCRCDMAPVLREDMPSLREISNMGVNLKTDLSLRQIELWQEHHQKDENSFTKFWKRTMKEMTVSDMVRNYNISKSSAYSWNERFSNT
jgi:hypothetical protein